jgi:hypothetical protein
MPLPKQVHIGPLTYPIVTDRAVINQATVDSQVTFYANIRFTETDILIDPNQAGQVDDAEFQVNIELPEDMPHIFSDEDTLFVAESKKCNCLGSFR